MRHKTSSYSKRFTKKETYISDSSTADVIFAHAHCKSCSRIFLVSIFFLAFSSSFPTFSLRLRLSFGRCLFFGHCLSFCLCLFINCLSLMWSLSFFWFLSLIQSKRSTDRQPLLQQKWVDPSKKEPSSICLEVMHVLVMKIG